jgi:RNA-directed DNA polymerase
MTGRSSSEITSTKQRRIAELAKQMPDRQMYSLSHHIDIQWMHEAYRRTRKDGSAGVDGQTASDYSKNLEGNLEDLLGRAKKGYAYRAPPVRRAYIPKGNGKTRPIGIPTFEDKVLQRAVAMALEPIYEQDFLDRSYGFRPGRSTYDALQDVWETAMEMGGGWLIDGDIESFFDSVDHSLLQQILRQRVSDGVITRLIGKWLQAGVMEEGRLRHPEAGTPQGGVISPLLANIYLHEVLDTWFEQQVRPRLRGRAVLIRYADDFVMLFERETDARRVLDVLPKRFGKYGLRLHPDKTRLVPFQKPKSPTRGGPRPGTFDLLGFTHFWAKSRRGNWVVKRKTAKDRFTRALRKVYQWCRFNRHQPVRLQHAALSRKLQGHYGYYGITGNSERLVAFRWEVAAIWKKWLSRRNRLRQMTWERMTALMAAYPLPPARVVHSAYRSANP